VRLDLAYASVTDIPQGRDSPFVTARSYPAVRHEILTETKRGEVMAELIEWMDKVVSRSPANWPRI
jgi:alpha-beta hydrolase superfamily lysophospholipase